MADLKGKQGIRAAVISAPDQPVAIRELPRPALEPGAVLLETLFSEVCGTDVHLHHGHLARACPIPSSPATSTSGAWPRRRAR